MDAVADLLAGYPFDVLLVPGGTGWAAGASTTWTTRFPWPSGPARQVDDCWEGYTGALEELAAVGAPVTCWPTRT